MIQEDEPVPPVSIIKPLMGIDPYLEENLESHFTLKYSQVCIYCLPLGFDRGGLIELCFKFLMNI